MGHYWREMDPEGAAESDRRGDVNREIRELQKKLRGIAASRLTVGDILDVAFDVTQNYSYDNTEILNRLRAAWKRR